MVGIAGSDHSPHSLLYLLFLHSVLLNAHSSPAAAQPHLESVLATALTFLKYDPNWADDGMEEDEDASGAGRGEEEGGWCACDGCSQMHAVDVTNTQWDKSRRGLQAACVG